MPGLFAILSPAKTLDMCGGEGLSFDSSRPRHSSKTTTLAKEMEKYTPKKLQSLMSISEKLAKENTARWKVFGNRSNPRGSAAMCFRGHVFQGLEAWTMKKNSLSWAQKNIRILSGLYGILRPLDTIQAYRLEMGTRLKTNSHNNLYEYWGKTIMKTLNEDMKESKATALINLASEEYSKAACLDELSSPVLNVKFLQKDGAKLKFVSFHAKHARGLMARWMADHRPKKINDLKDFNSESYQFNSKNSSNSIFVFSRAKRK